MSAEVKGAEFMASAAGVVLAVIAAVPVSNGAASPVALGAILLAMCAWIAWQDARTFTIPDGPLAVVVVVAVAARLHDADTPLFREGLALVAEAALCGGALLALREAYFRLRGVDGLGFGDVKLAAAAGALLGGQGFAWALLLASMAALAFVAFAAVILSPRRRIDRLPFGAFLAPTCWGLWSWHPFGVGW